MTTPLGIDGATVLVPQQLVHSFMERVSSDIKLVEVLSAIMLLDEGECKRCDLAVCGATCLIGG